MCNEAVISNIYYISSFISPINYCINYLYVFKLQMLCLKVNVHNLQYIILLESQILIYLFL